MSTSKQYFDEIGAGWDQMQESFFSEKVRERALQVAGIANVKPGRVAVDVGAGTGFITVGLLELGLQVIAVDQSPPMLEALRKKLSDAVGLDCRVGDAEQLPIDVASVDYCFANMCLHHVERPASAIREMARVLRPGGRLIITDLDTHNHTFLRTEQHDRWMGFAREEVRRWFADAGLADVSVADVGESCCSAGSDGQKAKISIFVAAGSKQA